MVEHLRKCIWSGWQLEDPREHSCFAEPYRESRVYVSPPGWAHSDLLLFPLFVPMLCFPCSPRKRIGTYRIHLPNSRYLQNGNILAARAFLTHFVSQMSAMRPDLMSSLAPSPIAVGKAHNGQPDETILTKDPIVNWAQLAVRTCQRAQGERNKAMREAWVRLCGTYQSKGGLLASKEVRKVSTVY